MKLANEYWTGSAKNAPEQADQIETAAPLRLEGARRMGEALRYEAVRNRVFDAAGRVEGKLLLGTWQGVFLFEHRRESHHREIALHLVGEWGPVVTSGIEELQGRLSFVAECASQIGR
jgi:hypothetical protein